jgi:hypothetical protein
VDIAVTGPLLQTKAKETGQGLHIEGFKASNGRLERFRTRQNINFRVLSGEAAAVDTEATEECKLKLQNLLNKYPPENQFNADEKDCFTDRCPENSCP